MMHVPDAIAALNIIAESPADYVRKITELRQRLIDVCAKAIDTATPLDQAMANAMFLAQEEESCPSYDGRLIILRRAITLLFEAVEQHSRPDGMNAWHELAARMDKAFSVELAQIQREQAPGGSVVH